MNHAMNYKLLTKVNLLNVVNINNQFIEYYLIENIY